ncbi:hypothetical protein ACQP00_41000 [Dactylosporangium sp. CS-047395]|uniref:hypothetical protein n=1 Tax=Dactylosporangium sp. CS-047395 TaxID=3239936 RepID=UPI003D90A5DC
MVRSKQHADTSRESPRPHRDHYANRETASGVFTRPAAPPERPPPPDPPSWFTPTVPRVAPPEPAAAPQLSLRPLRTPAPAVTTIRVEAVPVDGFEYETAMPFGHDPPEAPPPPQPPAPRPAPKPLFNPLAPKPERPTITWLDE